ncbi:hypothetical protein ABIE78_003385 [Sinorhizobium fredii]
MRKSILTGLIALAASSLLQVADTSLLSDAFAQQTPAPPAPAEAAPEPLSDDELEVLVARIALYPDELVALVSAAPEGSRGG